MLLPTTIQEGGGLGNKSILCLNKFLSLKLSKNQNEFLAPSEAKGVCLSVGHKVLFIHLSGSESKISFKLEAYFFVFSSQYIFVPLSVSTCVMRAPGVMSVTNVTSLCHAVFVTGVCPQLVVIAPSHSVSQHRHRSPEPAEKIALDCDTGPRSTLHMAKCETGNPSLDLGSSRVIRAPQCRANMCDYQRISMIIKCFMWSLDE